jgi:uncharacterized protein YjbI with pentapeptide repeats
LANSLLADLAPTTSTRLNQSEVDVRIASHNLDFTGMDLSGLDMLGCRFAKRKLINTNLSGANLDGVNLSGVKMLGVNLNGAKARNANLQGTEIDDNPNGRDAEGKPTMVHALFEGVNLIGANIKGAKINGANLDDGATIEVRDRRTGAILPSEIHYVGSSAPPPKP